MAIYQIESVKMTQTKGIAHLGLSVKRLDETIAFFTNVLEWEKLSYDETYPRAAVSDGNLYLTLWQVDHSKSVTEFDRRQNIGLHHLALAITSEAALNDLAAKIESYPRCKIEFMPELLRDGPNIHMMFYEPGGIRLELYWAAP